jgi:hypothetical protein
LACFFSFARFSGLHVTDGNEGSNDQPTNNEDEDANYEESRNTEPEHSHDDL